MIVDVNKIKDTVKEYLNIDALKVETIQMFNDWLQKTQYGYWQNSQDIINNIAYIDALSSGYSEWVDLPILDTISLDGIEIIIDYIKETADYAKEQGDYAKEQGDYAKDQGDYAKDQGDYAKDQGDYAKDQGDYAKDSGDTALEAAEIANNTKGWTAVHLFIKVSEEIIVKRLADYIGGTGTKPTDNIGQYVSENGYTSDIDEALNFKGLSAYEVWNETHEGTLEDYENWLQKPATDAVSLIEDKIDELDTAIQQESERIEAEGIRQSNEIDRVDAEETRVENEALRISAELLREGAESDREDAEQLRQTNTSTAIQNTNEAIQNANSAAELANTKAEEANTAAQNADDARLAIEGDLALKADHGYSSNPKTLKQVDDSLVQLAGEVSGLELKDVVQSDKIKDIENVISTMNPNQSAQLSVSGSKTVSLPKNASNGGMQVKLEGLTAENLVVNGDFRNGLEGWFSLDYLNATLGVNGIEVKSNSAEHPWEASSVNWSTYTRTLSSFNKNDKVYISLDALNISGGKGVRVSLGTGVGQAVIGSTYGFKTLDEGVNKLSNLITVNSNRENYLLFKLTANSVTAFNNIRLVNLTATFGAGNEPDLATCDAMFSDYFEGVKSFVPTGRIRSVDKNGLNPTALYLTAPELRSNGTVKDEIRKGANGYELVKRISDIDGTVLATPVISPINYGGILNSAENGTVYHEPVIADAGVYDTKIDVLLTDYPMNVIEEVIKYENGINTYLDVNKAVIAGDKLSFTHPDLTDGDLVLFTYAYSKESTNGNITASFYDSNVVKIDTVTGKAYRINEVVTNGVLTRTLTEV